MVVESATRPTLTADLADGLSRCLQVPVVGPWAIVDPDIAPGRGQVNSAQRVAAVGRRASLQADVPRAPVLLVDDQVGTGWTLTWRPRRSARPAPPRCCRWPWPPDTDQDSMDAMNTMGNDLVREARKRAGV